MAKSFKVSWAKCKQAASKRLPFMAEGKIEERLEMACLTLAEAYMCGAEEAQCEILKRLNALRPADPLPPASEGNAP